MLRMVTSNLGHCFMGYFFILLLSFELGWTELAISIFFFRIELWDKIQGKETITFFILFWRVLLKIKEVSIFTLSSNFSLQVQYGGNGNSSILIWSEMVDKELALCLCMWCSCCYDLTAEDWLRSSQFCPFLERACCWLMRLIWDQQVPKWIQLMRFFCLSLLLSRVA